MSIVERLKRIERQMTAKTTAVVKPPFDWESYRRARDAFDAERGLTAGQLEDRRQRQWKLIDRLFPERNP